MGTEQKSDKENLLKVIFKQKQEQNRNQTRKRGIKCYDKKGDKQYNMQQTLKLAAGNVRKYNQESTLFFRINVLIH